jgi:transcriptional regulator with XRE-family HTH domain
MGACSLACLLVQFSKVATNSGQNRQDDALGRNMVMLRSLKGLTQERAAEKAKLTPRYYQSIEYGEKYPSVHSLAAIREALGCSWNDLMKGVKSK